MDENETSNSAKMDKLDTNFNTIVHNLFEFATHVLFLFLVCLLQKFVDLLDGMQLKRNKFLSTFLVPNNESFFIVDILMENKDKMWKIKESEKNEEWKIKNEKLQTKDEN